jgi:hypothetical protein
MFGLAARHIVLAGYLGAHVNDPFALRSAIDPATDGEFGWRGGGLQIRLRKDPNGLGYTVEYAIP